ncbi:MAG TPA: hypothetical protein VJR89_32205 [Polyangiales bacterium]|nr:hypothetical protein [Polyangiales bacterium]
MRRSIFPGIARLGMCASLALAACTSAAENFQNGNVEAYAAPLDAAARWPIAPDAAQPMAAAANPYCALRNANGLSYFVANGGGFGAAGLAFGPLALFVPPTSGLTAGPASSSSTTFFMGIRLDPRAAPWLQSGITNTQFEYLTPLDSACGF